MRRRRAHRDERTLAADDRAVSIAVTHVLAIGITTLLISGLLIGASGLLTQQRDDAAREELNTIGNRLAVQIEKADSLVEGDGGSDTETVTFFVDQPSRVSGGTYVVRLQPGSECEDIARPPGSDPDRCLVLTPSNPDLDIRRVEVPVQFDDDSGEVSVTLENRGSGEFVITVEDAP